MALSLEPGYLDFDNLPDTNFTCIGKVIGGYYADLEANCQMFHVCTIGQADEPMDIRFLCLNGTVFDQETRVCERIDEVDCSKSEQFYSLNLELYGNSGPIVEESPEVAQDTEPPSIIIKSTTSMTTMAPTTTKRPINRPTSPHYYTTIRPPAVTTATNKPKVVSAHHFNVNAPDIRFNPEEINISLNPGAPPDIRTKHFLSESFSDSSQDIENDNVDSDDGQSVKVQKPERLHVSSSTSPKSVYAMGNQKLPHNSGNNFGFSDEVYQTELPQHRQQQFLIQTNSFRHSQSFPPNLDHNANQYHHQHFHSTTAKQESQFHQDPAHTTLRTVYLHSLKPPEIHQHHHYTHHYRTEKPPQRVQIPIPLLPTLPPLTFSSPAPFTLQRHIEAKRYTKDHQAPPRIIISASASVSDASGRRLNYSLGTIGAAQILQAPPSSYDDYKDSDVGLDPFYHDVPKINQKRRKRRSTEQKEEKRNPFDIIKDEKEAVEVLKFLFTWYQSHQATATVPPVTSPVTADLIHKINNEFGAQDSDSTLLTDSSEVHFTSSKEATSTESLKHGYENSDLFKKNGRYSIIGGYKNLHSTPNVNSNSSFKKSELKRSDKTRAGKNLEVDDLLTEITADMSELKEKMDDAEVTVVKDLKEAYFNPYDYVDDNYEGAVYKENSPNLTKLNNTVYTTHLLKKEDDIKNLTDHQSNKNFFLNPATVSELYKYFNVNRDSTTEKSALYSNTEDDTNSKNENTNYYTHGAINNKNEEIIEPNASLGNNISSFFNHTENLKNESVKFTEIKISSEVHDDVGSSSTTSKTTTAITTETPANKRSGIRRGRVRQRQPTDHYYNRQKNFNTVSTSTESHNSQPELKSKVQDFEKTDNHNLQEQSSGQRQQSRRGRKRGRSRFVDYYSSSSTTTVSTLTVSTTVENSTTDPSFSHLSALTQSIKRSFTDSPLSTLATLTQSIEKSDATLETLRDSTASTLKDANYIDGIAHTKTTSENDITEQHNTLNTNISGQILDSLSEEITSEKYFPVNLLDNIFDNSENRSSEDIKHEEVYGPPEVQDNKLKNKNEEVLKTQANPFNDSVTENDLLFRDTYYDQKNVPTDKITLEYETPSPTDSDVIQVETSTIKIMDEEGDHLGKNKDIVETTITTDTEHIRPETSTITPVKEDDINFSKSKDTLEFLPELKPVIETTEDSSYLIKLLKYFAETAITAREEIITTETPIESYAPLTENEVTTTENYIVPTYPQARPRNRDIEKKRGRSRNKHISSPRVSTTSLPTLRDIYDNSNGSKETDIKHESIKIADFKDDFVELTSKKIDTSDTQTTNDTAPVNIDHTTKLALNITDSELIENIQLKTKSELLERLSLIEENLAEKPNDNNVSNTPIVDTTATTPFVSFNNLESFGTTIASVTNPTKAIDDANKKVTKDLTQMFESSTEPYNFVTQSEPTQKNRHYFSFYEDVFEVPELTEKSSYATFTEANKNYYENTETTFILESTSIPTNEKSDQELHSSSAKDLDQFIPETTQTFELDSTSRTIKDPNEAKTPLIIKLENDLNESINNKNVLNKFDLSTIQPDVEIQKSISLPVSVLQTTFDISHDINNAQDINNLIPTSLLSDAPSTLRTTENIQEYIQDIEVSTKSIVAKDDQMRLGFTEGYRLNDTEIVPTTLITTENSQLINEHSTLPIDEHIKHLKYSIVPEVQHNATEILFVKDTESPKTSDNDSTTSLPSSAAIESLGMVNSSHLFEVLVETTTTKPVTTILTTTRIPYYTRRTRPPKRRPYNNPKSQFGRHRFSTELFTNKPQNIFTSQIALENITDAPLHKSATPTRSEIKKVSLRTTPLSSKSSRIPSKVSKHYVFNCFGKDKNKFYADPRDCRLFHYCTQGYSKNQLLDLKFVCDQKTFFDDDKLLCTKVKPTRCL